MMEHDEEIQNILNTTHPKQSGKMHPLGLLMGLAASGGRMPAVGSHNEIALEKRRAKNKVARKSRRQNRRH